MEAFYFAGKLLAGGPSKDDPSPQAQLLRTPSTEP